MNWFEWAGKHLEKWKTAQTAASKMFTPGAQQVLGLSLTEADRLRHNFLGTEHLLLGLIKFNRGVAVNVLNKIGISLESVRIEVEKQVVSGSAQKMVGNIPYTPRMKKVIALAQNEAKKI